MKKIVNKLIKENLNIVVAESMTGGYLSSLITLVPGASKVFKGGIVVYSSELKAKVLKVNPATITKYSSVSIEVLNEMNEGLKALVNANIYVSITGNAGPTFEKDTNELKCYILIEFNNEKRYELIRFSHNNRKHNIKVAINKIKAILYELLFV